MKPYYQDDAVTIYHGDALAVLQSISSESMQCVVTSPPYWGLRDYGIGGHQIGLEPTPELYVQHIVEIFREVRRVLRKDGTLWLNMADSYAGSQQGIGADGTAYGGPKQRTNTGSIGIQAKPPKAFAIGLKPKDLCGMPWRVAFALQADGWWLRCDIIWSKPNPMPESVTDRPTKAHEYIFLLTKREKYFWDQEAVKEPFNEVSLQRMRQPGVGVWQEGGDKQRDPNYPHANAGGNANRHWKIYTGLSEKDKKGTLGGRNLRSVWTIATQPFPEAHFATFPTELVKKPILAGTRPGDSVLDPFAGAGTTLFVAKELGRKAIGIEMKADYIDMAKKRLRQEVLDFGVRPEGNKSL